jgi:predicted PurR-regulated permease PerM
MEDNFKEVKTDSIPFYSRIAQIFVGVLAFFFILYIGQDIIIPILFAMIFAILLNPLVNRMMKAGFNRVLAIVLAIGFMSLIMFSVFYFIGVQVSMFKEAFPELQRKFTILTQEAINWITVNFDVSTDRIKAWIQSKAEAGLEVAGEKVGDTLLTLTGALVFVFLIPVYIFLILYYKPLLLEFFSRAFSDDKKTMVSGVLQSAKAMIQSYLAGLLIEMIIVAILESVALLIIGVDYAIVFGVIGALLNLVPYIGALIATTLPMLMAFVSGTPVSALYVLIAYVVIMVIDSNVIVPMVVASKAKINALVSIIVILIGGALWGIPGMILSIPLTAIVKVIFDNVQELKPYGYLLGDDVPKVKTKPFRFPWKKETRAKNQEEQIKN